LLGAPSSGRWGVCPADLAIRTSSGIGDGDGINARCAGNLAARTVSKGPRPSTIAEGTEVKEGPADSSEHPQALERAARISKDLI